MKIKAVHFAALLLAASLSAQERLVVKTEPAGAGVWHEGVFLGTTPLELGPEADASKLFALPAAPRSLIVYLDFHEAEIVSFKRTEGKAQEISLRLVPLKRLRFYDGPCRYPLDPATLFNLPAAELELLRAEVRAKSGKAFTDPALDRYFRAKSWYRANPFYSDALLDDLDRANLTLLSGFLDPLPEDLALFRGILKRLEFTSKDGSVSLIFSDATRAIWRNTVEDGSGDTPYWFPDVMELRWLVASGRIFLGYEGSGIVMEVKLDPERGTILDQSILRGLDVGGYYPRERFLKPGYYR